MQYLYIARQRWVPWQVMKLRQLRFGHWPHSTLWSRARALHPPAQQYPNHTAP